MTLPSLEEQRKKIHTLFSKAEAALHQKRITKKEYDAFLHKTFGTIHERKALTHIDKYARSFRTTQQDEFVHKTTVLLSSFFIVVVSLFTALLFSTGGITGAVVMDLHTRYTEDSVLDLDVAGVTSVTISGMAHEPGDIVLTLHADETYILYEYRVRGPLPPHVFTTCGEACAVNLTGTATLEIAVAGAMLTLDSIELNRTVLDSN